MEGMRMLSNVVYHGRRQRFTMEPFRAPIPRGHRLNWKGA